MSTPSSVPSDVLRAYGFGAPHVRRLSSLINPTFEVRAAPDAAPSAIVQRLHPVFEAEVNLDIDAITTHLAARGLTTPRLLRTAQGALWVAREDGVWRAQTFVPGRTYEALESAAQARAAGSAVAAFHRALADCEHRFHFARSGVHDTRAHLAALHAVVPDADRETAHLAERILAHEAQLPLEQIEAQPLRITHGDLKISNLRFADASSAQHARVVCLIDLDTLGPQRLAYELGDALRSWCNPQREDAIDVRFEADLFAAALQGYASGARGLLSAGEPASIVAGLSTVTLELASRFCRDVVEDRYFGWDETRYPSRRAHNLARARNQLALAEQVLAQRTELERGVVAAFA